MKENEAILQTRSDAKGKRDNKKLLESCVQLEPNGTLGIKREYLRSYCHLSWRILLLEANNSGNVVILNLLSSMPKAVLFGELKAGVMNFESNTVIEIDLIEFCAYSQ